MVLEILTNRTYRHLFLAQIVALPGTGLATVALGPLAYDLSGDGAVMVLGTVFSLKMVAYVGVAPMAATFAKRLNRRRLLIALDLVREFCALALPFVTEVWQVYLLIFALHSASAGFTPTFQATIPDMLRDEHNIRAPCLCRGWLIILKTLSRPCWRRRFWRASRRLVGCGR